MDELLQFLRARYDHEEQVARAASRDGAARWLAADHPADNYAVTDDKGQPVAYSEGSPNEEQSAHIALHDPARVLADVAAKRQVLAICQSTEHQDSRGMTWVANEVLAGLALPYADHDDYRPEWKPRP